MELEEVPPIEGDHRAPLANCEEKDFAIWPGLSRLPRISNRKHVVSESAEFLHPGLRKILIRQEAGHGSGGLVILDLILDQVAMASDEGPGVREILSPQGGIGAEKFCVARAQAAGLLEDPDWNPCTNDAGHTAQNAQGLLDTGERVAEIARNPLQ
jgi:hypothetical protein